MSVLVTGGMVLKPGKGNPALANIAITAELITAVDEEIAATEVISADGLMIAPGIIDLGVFATDKPAFRFGGITRAALMPDQSPVHDDPATIRFAALKGKPDFWVHPLAAATRGLDGNHMAEIALMKDAGAKAVATGRNWIGNSGVMLRIMQYCAALGMPLFVHSEDSGITANAAATSGSTATLLGLSAAPAMAEAMAVSRDLLLAEESGAQQWRLLAFERSSGKVLWNVVGHEADPRVKRHPKATHCNSTPATDGTVAPAAPSN